MIQAPTPRRMNYSYWENQVELKSVSQPLDRDEETDVLVIGAGFGGLSTVWHLQRLAPKTDIILVEQEIVGCKSSSRNAGMMALATAAIVWMMEESLPKGEADWVMPAFINQSDKVLTNLRDDDLKFDLVPGPSVVTAPTRFARELLSEMNKHLVRLEVPSRMVAPDAVREKWGGTGYDALVTDGYTIHPIKLATSLRDRIMERGTTIYEHTPIVRIESGPSNSFIARTKSGRRIKCNRLVDATGVWSQELGLHKKHDYSILHTYMFATDPLSEDLLKQAGSDLSAHVADLSLELNYRRIHNGRVLFGSYDDKIDNPNVLVDEKIVARLWKNALEVMPWLEGVSIDCVWGGPIKGNATDLPKIGAIPGFPQAYSVAGNTSCGVPWTLLGGAMVANLLVDEGHRDPDLDRIRCAIAQTHIPWFGLGWLGVECLVRSMLPKV